MLRTAGYKFGLCGTSCSGKTTLAYELVSRLKKQGVLADGVFNQDRKFSFPRELLETEEIAQHWMITNLISKEVDLGLHGDTDVLIMDRTPIDFMAYYFATHARETALRTALWNYSVEWCRRTYTKIFYLEPLPFQADGKRPDEEFVQNVDRVLKNLILALPQKVVHVERSDVFNTILRDMGIVKLGAKTALTEEEIQLIPQLLDQPAVVISVGNDVDIWVPYPPTVDRTGSGCHYTQLLRGAFGAFVPFDVHYSPDLTTLLKNPKTRLIERKL